jgi:DegT/DnrJ/EryC1/StrS aminotransferase family
MFVAAVHPRSGSRAVRTRNRQPHRRALGGRLRFRHGRALAGTGRGRSSARGQRHHHGFQFFCFGERDCQGARPVLVDIDPATFNLDPEKVAARLRFGGSHKIRALLPVHLYGQCADMDALRQLAEEFDLAIVEDAAQAIGAEWRGRQAGSLGAAAAFSFYPTKNLSAFGDGQALIFSEIVLHSTNCLHSVARFETDPGPDSWTFPSFPQVCTVA